MKSIISGDCVKKEKIKEFIIKHKKTVIACSVVCITLLIMVHMFLFNSMMNAGDNKDKVSNNGSNINPRVEEIQKKGAVVLSEPKLRARLKARRSKKRPQLRAPQSPAPKAHRPQQPRRVSNSSTRQPSLWRIPQITTSSGTKAILLRSTIPTQAIQQDMFRLPTRTETCSNAFATVNSEAVDLSERH